MRVRNSPDKHQRHDPEWLIELENFLNENGNKEKFEEMKKIFYETYLENIKEEMNPEEAMQKAKSVALYFLIKQ